MRALNHPNIVKLLDVHNTKNYVVLNMEYCGTITLEEYANAYSIHANVR